MYWSLAFLAASLIFVLIDPLDIGPLASLLNSFSPFSHLSDVTPSELNFHAEDVELAPAAASADIQDAGDRLVNAKLRYEQEAFGPESLAFDSHGHGPYASLSDGRVVRRASDDDSHWETVAITSPAWNATLCSYRPLPAKPLPKLEQEHICGRPLGIRFHPVTGDLLVADAYFGLFLVPKLSSKGCPEPSEASSNGGAAEAEAGGDAKEGGGARVCSAGEGSRPAFGTPRLLVDTAEGARFKFTNDMDIDATDSQGAGVVYFTDTSTKFYRRNFLAAIMEGGHHGRLMRHDLSTGATTVLVRSLAFPNGVALSKDRSFLVFCETTLMRCHKYHITGPNAGSFETLINLPGFPDNVRLNPRGRFWIALHARRTPLIDFFMKSRWLRTALMRLTANKRLVYLLAIGWPHGMILEVDGSGAVTDVLEDRNGTVVKAVSEVEEHGGKLWMGSVLMPHVAVLGWK